MARDLNDRQMNGEDLNLCDGTPAPLPSPTGDDAPRLPAPNPFRDHGIRPSSAWFGSPPPRRRWLLCRPDDHEGVVGWLPLGKVGMLAASGGSGKTMGLVQLALSVATGRHWLGTFSVPPGSTGRVLLALGEEDAEEARRRLHYAFQAMWPGREASHRAEREEAMATAARRILVVPLAAVPVALVGTDPATGEVQTTETLNQLLELLTDDDEEEWRLVVIDPLSRFAGPDTETDNASATRFVQAVERIAGQAHGKPTVLLSHHVVKSSRRGETATDAASVRGASALVDGVRWVATMLPKKRTPEGPDEALVAVELVKSNYGPPDHVREFKRTRGGALIPPEGADRRGSGQAAPDHEQSRWGA